MSRHPKGPRLYLRSGRLHPRTRRPVPDVWYIRDGSVERSTGCTADRLGGAEQALSDYLVAKQARAAPATYDDPDRPHRPDEVFVAEVLALYVTEKAPKASDPASVRGWVKALSAWWGDRRLSDIKRSTCEQYVAHRMTQPFARSKGDNPRMVTAQGARRELEELSAAVTYWDGEHKLTVKPTFTMPPKPESPRDALTRDQAARLLMAARGYRLTSAKHESGRPKWKRLRDSGPANRAHLKRFILLGLYTGTRPGVIPKVLWQESPTQAWADLDAETIFRRGKRERDHRTKRRPLVKIPRRLLAHMRRWQATDAKRMAARAQEGLPTTAAVIHHGGRPLAGRIRKGFAGCVADAGLAAEITPHWMRHTAATWMMRNSVDPWEAAGYLGMNMKTLIDNYGHHQPSHQMGAKAGIGGKRE